MSCSYFNILHLLEEAEADRLQRLLWPLVEPVDRCTVHHCRELPAANPQLTPHWRETQSHLEYTNTARSNRIECEVWYSSEIILIFFVSVSTARVTVGLRTERQGIPALISTSSWSRGGMENCELIICSYIIKQIKPPASMWIKRMCWAVGYVRLIFTVGDKQLACWEAQPDARYG